MSNVKESAKTMSVPETAQVINQNFENVLIDNKEVVSEIEVMSGVMRNRISQMNKEEGKNENQVIVDKAEAKKITKQFTFKVIWKLSRLPIETMVKEMFKAQSPIVALQAEIRKMNDDRIKKLVSGEETSFTDERYTIKNGVITINCVKFFEARKRESLSDEQKMFNLIRKQFPMMASLTDEQIKNVMNAQGK